MTPQLSIYQVAPVRSFGGGSFVFGWFAKGGLWGYLRTSACPQIYTTGWSAIIVADSAIGHCGSAEFGSKQVGSIQIGVLSD